ncbi:MAG TPA: hypothetical protein PKY81_01160 [bacterium]|nr:hypothetical protein [bacterium]
MQGFDKKTKEHKFTWQPHGSQFTIVEAIPEDALIIRIRKPEKINKETVLKNIGFSDNWVTVIKKNG